MPSPSPFAFHASGATRVTVARLGHPGTTHVPTRRSESRFQIQRGLATNHRVLITTRLPTLVIRPATTSITDFISVHPAFIDHVNHLPSHLRLTPVGCSPRHRLSIRPVPGYYSLPYFAIATSQCDKPVGQLAKRLIAYRACSWK